MANEQQTQENPLLKLYDVLHKDELYTKSFEEFKTKYSTDEEIDKLFSVVSEKEYYTKDLKAFKDQYFPKSNEVSSQGSEVISPIYTEPLQSSRNTNGGVEIPKGWATAEVNGSIVYYDPKDPENTVTNILPIATVQAPKKEDKGVLSDAVNSLAQGSTQLYANIAGSIETLYDLASTPINLLADAIENNAGAGTADWLRPHYEDISQGTLNPLRVLDDVRKFYSTQSEEYGKQVTQFDKGVFDSVKDLKLGDAGRQVINNIAQSIPAMVGLVVTNGAGTAPAITRTMISSLPFASGTLEEMNKTGNVPVTYRPLVALLDGMSEVILEERFGTKSIIDGILSKKLGSKELNEFVGGYLQEAFKKNGLAYTAVRGGASEGATQFIQNVLRKYSGENPDQDLMGGVADAVIVGSIADGTLASVSKIGDIAVNRSKKQTLNTLQEEISNLKKDLTNESLPDVVQQEIQNNLEAKTEQLNKEIETVQTEQSNLTPEQITEVETINNQIDELEQSVNQEGVEVSETTKQAIQGKVQELQAQLTEIENTAKESETTEGVVETEVEVVIPETLIGKLTDETFLVKRATELEQSIKDKWTNLGRNNLGIQNNESFEEWVQGNKDALNIVKEATEYAFIKIAQGTVKTAKQLGIALGIDNLNISQKIFDDANTQYKQYQESVVKPVKKPSVKSTIKESTEGGIKGKVTLTERQALIKQLRDFERGVKEGQNQTQEAGKVLTSVMSELKRRGMLEGLSANQVQQITSSINKVKDLSGVQSTVDRIVDIITPPKESVRDTIDRTTKSGIQGTETVSSRQALANQFKTLERGVKEGIKVSKEYVQTINAYVQSRAKAKDLKGLKFNSSVLNQLTSKLGGLKTDEQVGKVIDVIDKMVDDAQFRQKIERTKNLQERVKRTFGSKNTPADLRKATTEFAKVNILDLNSIDAIERYYDVLQQLSRAKSSVTKIAPQDLQRFIDLANANKEVKQQERANNQATEDSQKAKRDRLKTKLIEDLGIDEQLVDDIDNGTKSLDEVLVELQELIDENKISSETKMRNVAQEYQTEIKANKDAIRDSLPTTETKALFDQFLEADVKESSLLKRDLGGYILTMFNLLNNGTILGLGEYVTKSQVFDNVNNQSEVTTVIENLQTPNRMFQYLAGAGKDIRFTSGSVIFQQILKNVRGVGRIHNFTGFTDVQTNSVKAQKRIEAIRKQSEEVYKKHKKDLSDSVNNMVASIYADVVQYRRGWDADKIEAEYDLRLQAWGESLTRMENENNSKFQRDNKTLIDNLRKALGKIATKKVVDGKDVWQHDFNPSQLFDQLPAGQKAYYEFTRDTYNSLKDDYFAKSQFYLGLNIETDWENYTPRSYSRLESTHDKTIQRTLASGTGKINDVVANSFTGSATKATTGAGETRTISGDKLPLGSVLNPDFIGGFLTESGAMVYDSQTIGARKFTGGMLDTDANGLSGQLTDKVPMNLYSGVVANKILGDRMKIAFSSLPPNTISKIWSKMGKIGSVISLGGVAQYVKQITPLTEVLARVNPKSFGEAMATWTTQGQQVSELFSQADVSLRDIQEYQQPTKTKYKMSNSDMNQIRKMLSATGVKIDDITEGITDFYMSPLQNMDNFVAKLGWLAFYIDQTKNNNNGVIDLSQIDKDALAYANTQNSTVMNESDSSLQGNFTKQDWVRNMFPFISFSINSKIALMTSITNLANADLKDKPKYVSEVVGNIANTGFFNFIGFTLRSMAIQSGLVMVSAVINGSDLGDEDKKKLIDEAEKLEGRNRELNYVRSAGYALQDLMYGGLFGNYLEPVFQPAVDAVLEEALGKDYLEEIGYGEVKFKADDGTIAKIAGMVGTQGVFLKRILDTYKLGSEMVESDKDYITRAEGKINAEKTGIIVDPSKLTPEGIKEFGVPDWYEAINTTNFILSASTLIGASDQTTGSFRRQAQTLARNVLKKDRGTVSKQPAEEILKSANKFDKIEIKGISVPMDLEQKTKYTNDRLEIISTLKASDRYGEESRKRSKLSATEYEALISKLADEKVKAKFLKENKELVRELRIKQKAVDLQEKEDQKKRVQIENELRGVN